MCVGGGGGGATFDFYGGLCGFNVDHNHPNCAYEHGLTLHIRCDKKSHSTRQGIQKSVTITGWQQT